MIAVTLADCTRTSRLLTRAIAQAVTDLDNRGSNPPWSAYRAPIIEGTSDTLDRVMWCDELGGNKPYLRLGRIAGLEVRVDQSAPPGQIRIVDPASLRFVPIEVR